MERSADASLTVAARYPVGVVTISDRASSGAYDDLSGPAVVNVLTRWITSPWQPEARIVPDDRARIEAALCELADTVQCPLIITTGGTGPSPRDVTPEATMAVCDRLLPGFGEQMRAVSMRTVHTAILSRQLAGSRGTTLIINLPGKPGAIEECLGAVFSAVPYCIGILGGTRFTVHPDAPNASRIHRGLL